MLHLFGVLPWNPEQVLFEFIFSVSLLLQKDGITVNNTVKYLTIWHLKKVVFFCILCTNIFFKRLICGSPSLYSVWLLPFEATVELLRATLKRLSLFRMDHLIKLPQGL